MNEPYRVPAAVYPTIPAPIERQGDLMSKWSLEYVSLEWQHGDDTSVILGVEDRSARMDCDELRELAAMIQCAIDEVSGLS